MMVVMSSSALSLSISLVALSQPAAPATVSLLRCWSLSSAILFDWPLLLCLLLLIVGQVLKVIEDLHATLFLAVVNV